MRGERKREELFERRNLDILAVCQTKLKERGEVMFYRVKVIISGVRACDREKSGLGL